MKYIILVCLLMLSNALAGQKQWNTSVSEAELKDTITNKYWILDTCTIHLSEGNFSGRMDKIENLYNFTKYFLDRPDYHLEILFLKNTNYDTISSHWGRIMPSLLKEEMTYFNLDPLSFEIRDSIVTRFDALLGDKTLFRQVIFKAKPNAQYQFYLDKLQSAYKHKDREMVFELFSKDYRISNNLHTGYEAADFDISGLIDLYYQKKYKRSLITNLEILPSSYPIEIGEIRKISDNWYDEEEDITISLADFIDIRVESDLTFHYKYQSPDRNVFHLNRSFDMALKSFLGYEFEYDEAPTSSLPLNIIPVGETKEKLAFLKKYISPQVEVLERGACNFYIIWNFNWVSTEPWAISKIGLDKEERKAYVFYNKTNNHHNCIIYQLDKSRWIEMETLNSSSSPDDMAQHFSKRIMILYFLLIFLLTIFFIIRKREVFEWNN